MLTTMEQEDLINKIAELGGKGLKDEDILYEGQKLILPESFKGQLNKAIEFLALRMAEEDEEASFSRKFNYRPWDGGLCAYRALKKAFGMVHGKTSHSFFGKRPPEYIHVPISPTETEEVPWGQFQIPLLDNTIIRFGATQDKEYGIVFQIQVQAPRKYRFVVEGLFKLVADELATGSIYRGHAIDGQETPQFLDLRGLDASKVVYSEQVQADLEAHIWAPMRYATAHRELGLPLKRAILLDGTYGTGKSLAGYLTARVAEQCGWTFIMARPGRDNFLQVMQTARLYQSPERGAIVFFEDAESVTSVDQTDMISQVLDTFDGIQAKDTSIMVVLTTNHPELIHKAMHRPGRVDAQITIGELDAVGIEKLVRVSIPADRMSVEIDFAPIVAACKGYVPAFVKEAADRSLRYALARNGGQLDGQLISTQDLVHAANGLRPQFIRMNEATESSTAEKPLSLVIKDATKSAVAALATKEPTEDFTENIWDMEAVEAAQNNHN